MSRKIILSLLLTEFLFAASCKTLQTTQQTIPNESPGASRPRYKIDSEAHKAMVTAGLDPTAVDLSVDPCDDFYQFSCGRWLTKTEIPAERPTWGRGFSVIDARNEQVLHQILQQAAKNPQNDIEKKVGGYFSSCMDEAAVEQAGLTPIMPILQQIDGLRDVSGLAELVGRLHQQRIWVLFDLAADQDYRDTRKMISVLDQNGIGLPDRDYYFRTDDAAHKIRQAYLEHVANMLSLAGASVPQAKADAQVIFNLETELARVSKTRVERRDPHGMYNKIDRVGVQKLSPSFAWDRYFTALGTASLTEINVTSPQYLSGIEVLLKKTSMPHWRLYLRWHVLRSTAPTLAKRFVDEAFTMQVVLMGLKEQRPRWKRCIDATDMALGELLAQPFIAKMFAGESKTAAQQMIAAISKAFEKHVAQLPWMTASTKLKSLQKLNQMANLIGYPAKWRQYEFPIDAKQYAKNSLAARANDTAWDLAKIGQPVNRDLWEMTPPEVNAYYHQTKNQMVFPAGILQPPFYSVQHAMVVNLGAIGMVVGHELTHGFDDKGAQFDADGNLKNWWSPQDAKEFSARTRCVSKQYSQYEVLPGLRINGELTLGENVADMGGIKLAFLAYQQLTAQKKIPSVSAGSFNGDQLFFISTAQAWCTKIRDEYIKLMVQTDSHAPAKFRINGSLRNMPEFAHAFSCPQNSPMNPTQRCEVW